MIDTMEEFKKQHLDNYKSSILELIRNNTNVLVDEDIMSLIRKPPLDSMDLIKIKYLDLAKKNKIVLDIVKLDNLLDEYRNNIVKCCDLVRKKRTSYLEGIVEKTELSKDMDIIKFIKKDFINLNKELKKIVKTQLQVSIDDKIIKNIDSVFSDNIDESIRNKICGEVKKFVNGSYQKQLLENIDFKLLVKDTTLANGVKEQSERYLFTLANSRIFKQESK